MLAGQESGHPHTSVTLRWSNPRSSSLDVQSCSHACRVSPVEVSTKALHYLIPKRFKKDSSLLTNFMIFFVHERRHGEVT